MADEQQPEPVLRIPLAEERLVVEPRPVELGELRLHKRVDEQEEVLRQPVTREELEVDRVAVGRFVDEPARPRQEGEWLVIPLVEEVLVVQKRLRVTEEVRIRRRQMVEEQEVRATVRRERLEVEDATTHGAGGKGGA